MEVVSYVSDVFWSEQFWLPPNITWKDIEPGSKGINYADYRDLFWPIPLALIIICIRFITEKHFLFPLGKNLRIETTKVSPPRHHAVLEKVYQKSNGKLGQTELKSIVKQTDLSDRDIQRWLKRRRVQDRPTTLVKFSENCWKCLCYTFNFCFGLTVLWDKTYLFNLSDCAKGYPHHEVTNDVWWYYMFSLAFYWSQTMTQFFDNKRKDFWQMFCHHAVTVGLISFSWVCNIHRVGSLVLLIHDAADILVEAAKSLKYAKMQKACDVVFGLFTVTWVITRLMIFPRVLYACLFETLQPYYPVYFLLNAMLSVLFYLHIHWTGIIFQVLSNAMTKGYTIQADTRSSSESDESSQ